jgi:hypothetical protein
MASEPLGGDGVRGDSMGQYRVPVAVQEIETSRAPARRSARCAWQTCGEPGHGGSQVRARPPPPSEDGLCG